MVAPVILAEPSDRPIEEASFGRRPQLRTPVWDRHANVLCPDDLSLRRLLCKRDSKGLVTIDSISGPSKSLS